MRKIDGLYTYDRGRKIIQRLKTDKKNNKNFEFVIINRRPKEENSDEDGGYLADFIEMNQLIEQRVKEFNERNYKHVISGYKLLINHRISEYKENDKTTSFAEYDRLISYCEALFEYNKDSTGEDNMRRIRFFINNISFLCAEIMGIKDSKSLGFDEYLQKMKKYLNLYEYYDKKESLGGENVGE